MPPPEPLRDMFALASKAQLDQIEAAIVKAGG